jgi:hypothetical protein
MVCTFASSEKDNIPLACVGVLIFQEEELFDSIFLEGRNFDYDANGSGQAALDYEVLLSSHLRIRSNQLSDASHLWGVKGFTYPFQEMKQLLFCLLSDLLGTESHPRSHVSFSIEAIITNNKG